MIARIQNPGNDTRLKRSGNIEWYSIRSSAECFEDDKIFTGPDTTVIITYASGTKITLLPNSLVSLSKGYVSLSSGSIEINVNKGGFALEALGEKIPLQQLEQIRVTQEGEQQSIVPIGPEATAITDTKLAAFVTIPKLTMATPESGQTIVKFSGTKMFFSWRLSEFLPSQNFRLEISPSANFSKIVYEKELLNSSVQVPVENLPDGTLHWRVTELTTDQSMSSTFMLDSDLNIELTSPIAEARFILPDLEQKNIRFDWKAKHNLPQRIQVARDEDFDDLIEDRATLESWAELRLNEVGRFYWRAGYVVSKKITHWSLPFNFSIKEKAPPPLLLVSKLPFTLDFSLNPEYALKVIDKNGCISYELTVNAEEGEAFREKSEKPSFVLRELRNGKYSLQVRGTLPDGQEVVSSSQVFEVRNSPPVPAPVIKKKNVKVFVLLLKSLLDSVFPSASAQDETKKIPQRSYTLKWEGIENANYEIEISRSDKTVVIKEQTKDPTYIFSIPALGKYLWRVKTKLGKRWSEYSEYAEFEIIDRVTYSKEILMVSPRHEEELVVESDVKSFPLSWKEKPGSQYLLEIFDSADSLSPQQSFMVENANHILKFEEVPRQFFWRVTPVSAYGNKATSPEPFAVTITRKPEVPIRYQLQPGVLFSQTKFTQDFSGNAEIKKNADFAGSAYNFSGEYFLKSAYNHRSIAFETRYGSYTEATDKLIDTRLLLEYGWLSDPFGKETHNLHLGYLLHTIDFKFGENLSSKYVLNFASLKYSWIKIWSKKALLELTGSLLVNIPPSEFTPSFLIKPVFHYRLSQDWWMIALAMFERYTAKGVVQVGSEESDMTIQVQNLSVGFGISYRPE